MSGRLVSAVLKYSRVKGAARMVLVVLAAHDGEHGGGAWPSVGTIAREAATDPRTVQRVLPQLLKEAAIEQVSAAPGKVTHYCVIDPTPRHGVTPGTVSPLTNDPPTPGTVSPNPRHGVTQPPAQCHPNRKNRSETLRTPARARAREVTSDQTTGMQSVGDILASLSRRGSP